MCFALEEPLPVYGGEAMIAAGKVIGMTTSGDFGHSVERSLVLGYVPRDFFGLNTIEIEAFGRRSLANRIDHCAYDPKNERIRA
jgi:4-methylaminobutanoate oxidase (formaldehyde-forming)